MTKVIVPFGRSKESGHALVHLMSAVPATMREGSANAKYFGVMLKSATSDEAANKIRNMGHDKPWDIVRLAVTRGMVKLGKKVTAPEAPAKTAKVAAAKPVKPAKVVPVAKPARVRKAKVVIADRRADAVL